VLVDPGTEPSPACRLEARADRNGIISLAPLLWQGDLPGLGGEEPMFVRDLGYRDNAIVLEGFPERRPYVLMTPAPGARPALRDYQEGMPEIWGEGLG
jgi:hypothetical protein